MRIETVDASVSAAFEPWLAAMNESRSADWPEDPFITLAEGRGLAAGFGSSKIVIVAAREPSGAVLGGFLMGFPTKEDTHLARLDWFEVLPSHRRLGIGRALALHAEELAVREGRATITGGTIERVVDNSRIGDIPGSRTDAGGRLAASLGYEPALTEYRRDLELPVDPGRLDALEADARPYAAGYRIITWQGPNPDDLVEGRLELERAMSTDAPHGDLDVGAANWDLDRLRKFEASLRDMGIVSFYAGAVQEATGQLVAFTVASVTPEQPVMARQWATIVGGDHRGHRLGMLVKVANLRELAVHSAHTRRITTTNADTNSFMVRVNDELGYALTGRFMAWQKRLTALGVDSAP